MGRGKTTMELITNERSRMITYHKRKKGLMKKVEEFRILCGVDACVIIFGPKFSYRPADIETWPTNLTEMREIISNYKGTKGSDIRGKKVQDLSDYFSTRKKKIDDEIYRLRKAKMEAKFPKWHNRLNFLSSQQLWSLAHSIETKIEVAKKKVLEMKSYQDLIEASNKAWPNYHANSLFPNSMEFDFLGKQLIGSSSYPLNQALHDHQMLPFTANPMDNAMLMLAMNGEDFTQLGGLNVGKNTYKSLVNYDTGAASMAEMFNNPGMFPMGWNSPRMQPMLPYVSSPMIPNAASDKRCTISQLSEINELEVNKRGSF